VKVRLLSVLGALALTATVATAPAAAAGTSTAPDLAPTISVLTPAQLGSSAPAQIGVSDYPWASGTWDGMSMSPWSQGDTSSDAGRDFRGGDMHMRHHPWWGGGWGMWGRPTGSPWPWWAGMPLWQISAMTGGTWPWAFGPPLFLPPPVPPVPPLGVSLFNIGLLQQGGLSPFGRLSAQAIFPGRLSAQAFPAFGFPGFGFIIR